MPKVSVYLPDDLYRQARERDLPLSKLTQEAVERAIRTASLEDWIERVRSRPPRVRVDLDVHAVLDEVREEFGT
jgi:nitrogen-specific signal transduction histidine kinase